MTRVQENKDYMLQDGDFVAKAGKEEGGLARGGWGSQLLSIDKLFF